MSKSEEMSPAYWICGSLVDGTLVPATLGVPNANGLRFRPLAHMSSYLAAPKAKGIQPSNRRSQSLCLFRARTARLSKEERDVLGRYV